MAIRIAIDAGNSMTKGTISPVNVENPQSQVHSIPFLEFGGAKDTTYNMKDSGAAFDENNMVRRGVEAILTRRLTLIKVKMDGKIQTVLVENTSKNHSITHPKGLPQTMSESVPFSPAGSVPEFRLYPECKVQVDVDKVHSMAWLKDMSSNKVHGLVFKNDQGVEVARVFFPEPMTENRIQPHIRQLLLIGIFTADLEFLSKFLGHQGASAKFMCMFCLACKSDVESAFLTELEKCYTKRSMKQMFAWASDYKERMAGFRASQKKNRKSGVTIGHTFSVVDEPMSDGDLDSFAKATMHVILGMTPWFVRVIRATYKRLEALEANARRTNDGIPPQLREAVELAFQQAIEYENELMKIVKDTDIATAISITQTLASNVMLCITHCEEEIESGSPVLAQNPAQQQELASRLQGYKLQYQQIMAHIEGQQDEKKTDECHLLEQLYLTREAKKDLETILKKHEGHAARVVGDAMKMFDVDEEVYHSKAIVGNGCMNFGERGRDIIDEITRRMKDDGVITDPIHVQYLDNIRQTYNDMLAIWYRL